MGKAMHTQWQACTCILIPKSKTRNPKPNHEGDGLKEGDWTRFKLDDHASDLEILYTSLCVHVTGVRWREGDGEGGGGKRKGGKGQTEFVCALT
jgi:hypothetical protein